MRHETFFLLVSILVLFGVAHAGTVTITGSCRNYLLPGNIINFTIINTGNDTPYNLVLTPVIFGARSANSSYSVNALPPRVNITFLVPLTNITRKGTFVDAFIIAYQQGLSVPFTAIFPCVVSVGTPTTSEVFLSSNSVSKGDTATINVSMFNGGRNQLQVNVSALLPPTFTFVSDPYYVVSLGPFATNTLQFVVRYQPGQATYTGAVSASYQSNGTNYASFAYLYVTASPAGSTPLLSTADLLIILVAAIIIVVLLLIARSLIRNRRREKK